jgi:hypothetical protein
MLEEVAFVAGEKVIAQATISGGVLYLKLIANGSIQVAAEVLKAEPEHHFDLATQTMMKR